MFVACFLLKFYRFSYLLFDLMLQYTKHYIHILSPNIQNIIYIYCLLIYKTLYTYIVSEYIKIFVLGTEHDRNDQQVSHFYLFLTLIQINFIFRDNVLYYVYTSLYTYILMFCFQIASCQ